MRDSYVFYADRLTGEYKDAFAGVETYALSISIDEETQNEKLDELLDMFLSAQEAGTPLEKIIGNNMDRFCKNYFFRYQYKK